MTFYSTLEDNFKSLATQLPLVLVCLIGFIIIMLRARHLGKAALPAMLGFGFAIILTVVSPIVWVLLPQYLIDSRNTDVPGVFAAISVIQSFCWAGVLALLLMSITARHS
jgi:hypothetical protein